MNKHHVWMWILVFIVLFGGCGGSPYDIAQQTATVSEQLTVQPTTTPAIRYHQIDSTTTVFSPYPNVVCFYVESAKRNERYDSFWKVSYSAEYTSGLSCVRLEATTYSDDEYENYIEKYPIK